MLNVGWNIIDDCPRFVLLHVRRSKQRFCLLIDHPPIINDECIISIFNRSDGWINITDKIIDYDISHVFTDDHAIHIGSGVLMLWISAHIKLIIEEVDEPVIGYNLQLTILINPPVASFMVTFGKGKRRSS